jgi:hypothetical protein
MINWEEFRTDAIKDAGLEGHPKAEYAYVLAWRGGWEGGPLEVMAHLRDIAKMLLGDEHAEVSKN